MRFVKLFTRDAVNPYSRALTASFGLPGGAVIRTILIIMPVRQVEIDIDGNQLRASTNYIAITLFFPL